MFCQGKKATGSFRKTSQNIRKGRTLNMYMYMYVCTYIDICCGVIIWATFGGFYGY